EAEAGNTKYAKVDGTQAVADVRAALEKNPRLIFSRSEALIRPAVIPQA
ncbi:hypothetical protein ACUX1T_24820, partial [Salmonella enterica]